MKTWEVIRFDADRCRAELAEFRAFLDRAVEYPERSILRFFRENPQLALSIGALNAEARTLDRIAFEYPLFGDFTCDLVVGDSTTKSYCFIEFEDARSNSIFVKKNRGAPEWAPRFDQGYSQIIDWFWKLDDMSRTGDFEHRFEGRSIDYSALLVVGRRRFLDPREAERLQWRRRNVVVNSKHVGCYTLDDLYDVLASRIKLAGL